ncbi:COX7A, subunit VIIa of cytochrome c oxidase [Athelia psychrophila]|uniref:COX7A, subunit VIIa of cytochrome c oxidase n=1 Tax=Athelia psychrophila TaxID=1759441 RepID=A0A166NZK4_9AGAM|nr:COX7A, subunit VIIa of cytochrome c oxidase [Fibularhizoctonia sp. CBS 109695]
MIAPITGKLRKKIWLDLSVGIGLGVTSAYGFWYGWHLRKVAVQEEFYLKMERQNQIQGQ